MFGGNAQDCGIFMDAMDQVAPGIKTSTVSSSDFLIRRLTAAYPALPDIIMLDWNMPQKGGIECLKELRSFNKFKAISVIMCSNTCSRLQVEDSYRHGANRCFQKPASFEEVKRLLRLVLATNFQQRRSVPGRAEFVLR